MRKAGEEWKKEWASVSAHLWRPEQGLSGWPRGEAGAKPSKKTTFLLYCLSSHWPLSASGTMISQWLAAKAGFGAPFTSSISGFRTFNLTNLTLQLSLSWGDNSEHKMCSFWITYHICLVLLVLRSLLDASFQCCSGFLVSRYAYSSFCEYRGSNTHFLFSPAAYFINEDI